MKLLSGVFGLTLTSLVAVASANAGDLYGPVAGGYKDGYVPAAVWAGPYLGVNIGYGSGNADVSIPNYPSTFSFQPDGAVGGVHAGYNWQFNRWVLGVEGDFSGSAVSGSHNDGLTSFSEQYKVQEDWRASIRGRLGYAFDGVLVYATGGAGFVKIGTSYIPNCCGTRSAVLDGYNVGAGAEYALTPRWIGRVEYLYGDYGTGNFVHNGPSSVGYETNEVRAGISYKFGPAFDTFK